MATYLDTLHCAAASLQALYAAEVAPVLKEEDKIITTTAEIPNTAAIITIYSKADCADDIKELGRMDIKRLLA